MLAGKIPAMIYFIRVELYQCPRSFGAIPYFPPGLKSQEPGGD
jgi:hypothetical protein